MLPGKKNNIEEDNSLYDAEVIKDNNSCIKFAIEGNRFLSYIWRVSDNTCSCQNQHPKAPRYLSKVVCDSRIGLETIPGAPNDLCHLKMFPNLLQLLRIVFLDQPSEILDTPKTSWNALPESDTLLKLTLPSSLSISCQTLLNARSDNDTFR